MDINVAIYARTSPDCPFTSDQQIDRLKVLATERGWLVGHVFTDRPVTVQKGLDRRPGEAAMLDAIHSGMINKVLVWSIDRVGRSLAELVGFLETCRTAEVAVYLHEQGIDTETSNGVSLFDITAMMALYLRQGRRDRILRGQAAARALLIPLGRPPISKAKMEKAKQFLEAGRGVREVARLAGISASACSRLKNSIGLSAT